jgi:hypothetical protein
LNIEDQIKQEDIMLSKENQITEIIWISHKGKVDLNEDILGM